jgi:hypothetical protein
MKSNKLFCVGFFVTYVLALSVSADVFQRVNNITTLNGYTDFCESDHVTVWYPLADGNTQITANDCKKMLNEFERIYSVYIDDLGYPHPYPSGKNMYKINVVMTRPNCNSSNTPACVSGRDNTGTATGGTISAGGQSTPGACGFPETLAFGDTRTNLYTLFYQHQVVRTAEGGGLRRTPTSCRTMSIPTKYTGKRRVTPSKRKYILATAANGIGAGTILITSWARKG